MKKIVCVALLAGVSMLRSAGDAVMMERVRSSGHVDLSGENVGGRREGYQPKRETLSWRQRIQNFVSRKGNSGKPVGKGSEQATASGQGGTAVSTVEVAKPRDLNAPLDEAERAAVLRAAIKIRPSLWDRFRGNKVPDVEPYTLQGTQQALYVKLVGKFAHNPSYDVTVEDLEGLTVGERMIAERIINTARNVGREQNRLMKGLTRESRLQVLRVLDEEKNAQSLTIPQYLERVRLLVDVEKWIVEEMNKLPENNSGVQDRQAVGKFFENKSSTVKEAVTKLINAPMDEGDAGSIASGEYAPVPSGKVTWAKANSMYQLVERNIPGLKDEEIQETLNAVADRMARSGNDLTEVQKALQNELRAVDRNGPLGNQLTFVNLLVRNSKFAEDFKKQIAALK